MRKESKFTKSLVLIAAVFCMLAAAGCGAGIDTEGNQEKESSAGDEYELVYAEELET